MRMIQRVLSCTCKRIMAFRAVWLRKASTAGATAVISGSTCAAATSAWCLISRLASSRACKECALGVSLNSVFYSTTIYPQSYAHDILYTCM